MSHQSDVGVTVTSILRCGSDAIVTEGDVGFRIGCKKCGQVHYTDEACPAKAVRPRKIASVEDARENLRETVASIECGDRPSQKLLDAAGEAIARQASAGDICPTCGQRTKPMTGAERQRAYRKKKNA